MIPDGNFWTTPNGQVAIDAIKIRGEQYWSANVYNYYHRGTGALGRSCTIAFSDGKFSVSMLPLIDPETGASYGRSIRHGITEGPGEYNPERGVRTRKGWYPGVSVSKFWLPWMRDFQGAFRQIVHEEVRRAMKAVVKQ
jgi:hypothetical protein